MTAGAEWPTIPRPAIHPPRPRPSVYPAAGPRRGLRMRARSQQLRRQYHLLRAVFLHGYPSSPPLLSAALEGSWPILAWGRSRSKPAWWSGKEPWAAYTPAPRLLSLMAAREVGRSLRRPEAGYGLQASPGSRLPAGLGWGRSKGSVGAGTRGPAHAPPLPFSRTNLAVGRWGSARPAPRAPAVGETRERRPGRWRGGGPEAERGPASGVRAPRVFLPNLTGGRRISLLPALRWKRKPALNFRGDAEIRALVRKEALLRPCDLTWQAGLPVSELPAHSSNFCGLTLPRQLPRSSPRSLWDAV